MGGLEGCIGLPALQPVPCLSGSCMGGEGHGGLVYQIYLVYRELCHLVQYTCPIILPLTFNCILTAYHVCNHFLPTVDKDPHLYALHGKECSSDDRCSECYEWSEDMWQKVSDYHLVLAAQREKKERKGEASSSSSFSGFSPSTPVPLMCLSSLFDSTVVSTVATSIDSCQATYSMSTLIVSASLFVSPIASTSSELNRKRKQEHSGLSSGVTKLEMQAEYEKFWFSHPHHFSPVGHPGPSCLDNWFPGSVLPPLPASLAWNVSPCLAKRLSSPASPVRPAHLLACLTWLLLILRPRLAAVLGCCLLPRLLQLFLHPPPHLEQLAGSLQFNRCCSFLVLKWLLCHIWRAFLLDMTLPVICPCHVWIILFPQCF